MNTEEAGDIISEAIGSIMKQKYVGTATGVRETMAMNTH